MPNIKQTIDGHSKTKLSQNDTTSKESKCYCRKKEECPISKKYLVKSIVYQATVSTNDNSPHQTYVGLTENSFKTRYYNHKTSFTLYEKRNSTELSKYVWQLKRRGIEFHIKWQNLKRAKPYSPASNIDVISVCGKNTTLLYVNLNWLL